MPGIHVSLPEDRPAGFRQDSDQLYPGPENGGEQEPEAVSVQFP